jgi:hypothetical protein
MARETKAKDEKSSRSDGKQLSIVDSVRILAAHDARADLASDEQLTLFLKSWWSRTYNRPLKDPLLQTYTLEELLYEFYDKIERRLAEEERINSEADKIEDSKEQADLDWAEQEEKRELEALKAKAANQEATPATDPTKDPANVAWMEEQMSKAKELLGEDFGEDIEESFE